MAVELKDLTKRSENYSQWYNELVVKADLAIPPACAPQDTLVRVALMATHTVEQVDYAVEKLTKCFKELGIIK